jgi:hypothetical protein
VTHTHSIFAAIGVKQLYVQLDYANMWSCHDTSGNISSLPRSLPALRCGVCHHRWRALVLGASWCKETLMHLIDLPKQLRFTRMKAVKSGSMVVWLRLSFYGSITILMYQELGTLITKLYPCAFLYAFDYINCI